jgi:chemotaxis protein methyltransferase WspC
MVSAPLKGNPPRKQSPSESSVIGSYTSLVAEIEQLADRGDLLAAQQRCEWVLSTGADDAEVLFLCGVIAQARGDSVAARQLLERAILRQPDHARALLQLSAVLHAAGDGARAEELGLRAQDVLREHKQAKNVDD